MAVQEIIRGWSRRGWVLLAGMVFFGGPGDRARAAEPRINEVMADNKEGLSDEDGDEVDWVEIHNPNPVPIDLEGWGLSDDPAVPMRWVFPAVSVNGNGYLVVFASGKNRRVSGSNLHTDFSLRAAGESVILTKPDGVTVADRLDFGPQGADVSYGVTAMNAAEEILIGPQAPGRARVPVDDSAGTGWTLPGFDDASWTAGTMDLGYEAGTGYAALIGLNVLGPMSGQRNGCYVRIPFPGTVRAGVLSLTLRMRYDDGFAVYLNGTPLSAAFRNAPAVPAWNSVATMDHPDAEAVLYEEIDISQHSGLLSETGVNVLAVHGMNGAAGSSDFLIGPQLKLTRGSLMPGFMNTPTPGAANSAGVEGFVAETAFSVERGFLTAPANVSITCPTPGVEIRYTRNGSTPSPTNGFVYSGPVSVESTTVLRAAAFRPGWKASPVATRTYLFVDDVVAQSANGTAPAGWPSARVNGQRFDYGMDPEVLTAATPAVLKQAMLAVPTVSLVTDQSNLTDPAVGIYVSPQSRGEDAERPVSLEIINDGMNPAVGGFQQDGGLRIRGGFSRDPNNPKHSFRLFFRNVYGKGKMDYPLFGPGLPSEFDGIDLRTSQDASWAFLGSGENTFLRDEVSRATQTLIAAGSRVRYVHLYLNGQYWGLYDTDERPNKGYGVQYFGGDEDDFDVVKTSGYPGGHTTEASDGTMAAGSGWHQLWTGARAVRAVPANANYFKLMGRAADGVTPTADPVVLDAVNLADYLLVLFYMGGNDGPVSDYVGASNNWFGMRDRTGSVGFRFFIHDFEQSLGLESGNNQRVGSGALVRPWSNTVTGVNDFARSNPEFIHEDLAWNLEYRVLFGDRAHRHFFNDGVMMDAAVVARMQGLAAGIDVAIWGESARWGDSVRAQPFVRADWLAANQRLFRFITSGTNQSGGTGRVNEMVRQLRAYDGGTKPLYPLVNAPVFSQHGGPVAAGGGSVTLSHNNTGSTVVYYTLDGSDPRAVGGAVAAGALVHGGGAVAVTGWTRTLKSRVLRGTEWSALNEAVFTRAGAVPPIVLTEIHAVPASPSVAERAAGFGDKEDFEFIELMNAGSEPVDLRNVSGVRGISFRLADEWLEPGARAVVVSDLAAFRMRYGPDVRVVGEFEGSLADGGERLGVNAAAGGVLAAVDFSNNPPWPEGAEGFSLVRISATGAEGDAANWRMSVALGGSPGAGESMSYADWKIGQGGPAEDSDADADGLAPLLEYAVGGTVGGNDAGRLPWISRVEDRGSGEGREADLNYVRNRGADDLRSVVEWSPDLSGWSSAVVEVLSRVASADGTERIAVRAGAAGGLPARGYVRVRWERIP